MRKEDFATPDLRYRGVTLWMLNDRLEIEELERQIDGFHAAGWGALITRTFNGLRTPYLSEEWHALVRAITDRAASRGMAVFLQAGYMPSGVPVLAEDHRHLVLVRRQAGHREPSGEAAERPVPGERLLLEQAGWAYYERPMDHVLDLLNPEACAAYLEDAYTRPLAGEYADRLGSSVQTVWVDEPHFQPPLLPWTGELPRHFRSRWGYDIVASLPALFADAGDFRKVRHHYWRTVTKLLLEAYFAQVSAWCGRHNVAFGGHLMGEDTLQAQVGWTGACMPCYEYMGLPGIDHLTRSLAWPAEKPFIITAKQCSSAANQLGKPVKLAEMYGVSSQGLSFEDRKRIGDWIMMLGINERCYHGSFYSLRGRRKRIYAPHLSHQQPWWPHNRLIADYFARLSYLMRQGEFVADLAVIHPLESAYCEFDATGVANPYERVAEPPAVRSMTEAFIDLSATLLRIHRGFEYADETILERHGSVAGARLVIGRMSYRAVLLPTLVTLRRSTVKLLAAFMEAGGPVLSVGELPRRVDGELDAGLDSLLRPVRRVLNDAGPLGAALDELVPADVELVPLEGDAGEVWMHERRVDGRRLFILTNPLRAQTIRGELRIGASGTFQRWNAVDGSVTECPVGSACTISLAPAGSDILVFTPGSVSSARGPRAGGGAPQVGLRVVRRIPVAGSMRVRRESPNVLPLDFCRYRKGDGGSWSPRIPVVAAQEILAAEGYEGTVTLRFEVEVGELPSSACLVLEDAEEWMVTANGSPLAYAGLPHYVDRSFKPVDVAAQLEPGRNVFEASRHFVAPAEPKFRLGGLFHTATGVELETAYLIGDFAVHAEVSAPAVEGCVRLSPDFRLAAESETTSGDLVLGGYPFYAGLLSLSARCRLPAPRRGERAVLVLGAHDAVVSTVAVNGESAGTIAWPPHEVELTSFIRDGENTIELGLATSLRNLLGPHHRPSGEPDQLWADGWTGRSAPGRRDTRILAGPDWWQHRTDGSVFWTDDYFVLPFGVAGGVSVEYRDNER